MSVMLIARLLLAAVFVPHALGKVSASEAFLDKFPQLNLTLMVLIVVAELSGAIGVLLGAVLRPPFSVWVTRLGVLAIAIVQVGAVIMVHWPNFFYWSNGFEYNMVLLGLCLMLAIAPDRFQAQKIHRGGD